MQNVGFTKLLLILVLLLLSVKITEIYTLNKDVDELIVTKSIAQEPSPVEPQADANNVEDESQSLSVEQIKDMTEEEIDILKRLSDRRRRLNEWEDELRVRYSVLDFTEEKIDNKLEELRDLKKKVEEALKEYRKEEDKKTQSLVKIYENMKPKDAAEIMSRMKIINILPIIDKMKEKNAAEILAKMDPRIAKEITSRLTEVGRMQN